VLSIVVPALFAALLGYFMFYGRLSDVYLGVITLSVTLIFFNLTNSTAGDAYRIGRARLNGFNGMPSLPTFNVPGDPGRLLDPTETFYLVMALLLIVYVGLRALLASHFGRVVVAVRENETRCELLGYDVRQHKLLIFTLGGAIAGLAGSLFANWGAFVSPNVFSLTTTSQIIIWVIVGGLGTLVGPIIGCVVMQYLATALGTQQLANTSLIFGIIFLAFVLLSGWNETLTAAVAARDITLAGVGMGMIFVPMLIAVQSAVPRSLLGSATSLTSFFRTIGGAVGVAVMGAAMTHRLERALAGVVATAPDALREPLQQLAAHPDLVVNPITRATLDSDLLALMRPALAHAVGGVFVVGLVVAVVALLSGLLVPAGHAHDLAIPRDRATRPGA